MAKLWLFQCKKEILYHCSHPGPETSELIQEQIKIGVASKVSQAPLKYRKIRVLSNYFLKYEKSISPKTELRIATEYPNTIDYCESF